MPRQIEVLVRDISRDEMGRESELYGTQRILTYKSFLDLNRNPEALRYELIYEVDENGKEVSGNPNLSAQHRVQASRQRSAAVAGNLDAGPSEREKELLAEIARLKAAQSTEQVSTPVTQVVTERKKPGPKPKALQDVTEEVA